jgi:hypothetical protein
VSASVCGENERLTSSRKVKRENVSLFEQREEERERERERAHRQVQASYIASQPVESFPRTPTVEASELSQCSSPVRRWWVGP